MEVRDIEVRPGEIAFEADGVHVHLRSTLPVTADADAVLATCLMPAMSQGGVLEIPEPVSPRLLRTQVEWQIIELASAPSWPFPEVSLTEVEVRAPEREVAQAAPGRGVAVFFSGGVDSWSVLLDTPGVTDVIFARGLDLWEHEAELADEVEGRLRDAMAELGLPLHVVETNLRDLSDPLARWEIYFTSALAAIALMHQERFERVVIAGSTDHATTPLMVATDPSACHLWSSEQMELVLGGGRRNRMERVAHIAGHPVVQRSLRVCWENPGGAYNCGRCHKCLMTMIALEVVGRRAEFPVFPPDLPLDRLDAFEPRQPTHLLFWSDIHDAAVAAGRDDLSERIAPLLARGRRNLELPDSYHPRRPWTEAVAAERERADRLQHGLDVIRASRSWRLTEPLRRRRGT